MSPPNLTPTAERRKDVFADIAASRCLDGAENTDLLAVLSCDDSTCCQVIFARGGTMEIQSIVLLIPAAKELDELQQGPLEEFHAWFVSWSRNTVAAGAGERTLLIKVEDAQRWLLRVPLTLFIRRNLPGFSAYQSIMWIVTERTFCEVIQNRKDLVALLEDAESLIRGTVVVLNTYQHFREAPDAELVAAGTSTAETILAQLQDVPFPEETLSLRWLKNPSRDELTESLLNRQTRAFIANFESGEGQWELGESAMPSDGPYFDLAPFQDQLSHIQLMRVFHCHSLFSPFVAATFPAIGMKPADRTTIARQLLFTQAQFVEGATMEETYLEFIAFLFQFLMCSTLSPILRGRAGSGRFSWTQVAQVCNQILEVQEFNLRVEDW